MLGFSHVTLLGNVTRDPVLDHAYDGRPVIQFCIAINYRTVKKDTGEVRSEVSFVDIKAWGKLAEKCSRNVKKGLLVHVSGNLKEDRWVSKEGIKCRRLKVLARDVRFLNRSVAPQKVEETKEIEIPAIQED